MKILLKSIATIFVVTAVSVYGTSAYFSDPETSQNNQFQASTLDLKVGNTSYYNGQLQDGSNQTQTTSWQLDDISNQVFFSFSDIKPGDLSQDIISLQPQGQDAWMCSHITVTEHAENTVIEPEQDLDTPDNGPWDGELATALQLVIWPDDGDGVLESDEVLKLAFYDSLDALVPLTAGNQGAGFALTQTDSNVFGDSAVPVTGDDVVYLGKAWCLGTLTLQPLGQDGSSTARSPQDALTGVACAAAGVDNRTQTDTIKGSLQFSAHQAGNNAVFSCPLFEALGDPPSVHDVYADQVTTVVGTFGAPSSLSSDPAVAQARVTGAPDGQFIQISDNSSVTLAFTDNVVVDAAGADLRVHIFDTIAPGEAEIEVSQDGISFVSLGTFWDDTNHDIDLAGLLPTVSYLRITDLVAAGDPYPQQGFDLDAVEGLNSIATP